MNREEIDVIFNTDNTTHKYNAVSTYLQNNNSTRDYHYLFNRIKSLKGDTEERVNIAVLSSFTFDQLKEILSVETSKYGLLSDIYISGYNQYQNEIIKSNSSLYKFDPDFIILAIRIEDIYPDDSLHIFSTDSKQYSHYIKKIIKYIKGIINSIKNNSNTKIIINNFAHPIYLQTGIYDFQMSNGQIEILNKLNAALIKLVSEYTDTFVFNLNYYLFLHGALKSFDYKMLFTSNIPYNIRFIIFLAKKYSTFIKSTIISNKCLVIDLDNTIWGGILGEEGIDGILLDHTYPGSVFRAIQKIIKQYSNQGIILAINSKNNYKDVKEVFDQHPYMILKWDDFAAVRINWNQKPQNMKELAIELNIGIDSFVFIDDNPFEIQLMKEIIPQINVVQFTKDIINNLSIINNSDHFHNLYLTDSDNVKKEQYKTQAERNNFKKGFNSIEEFYIGLNMCVEINICDKFALRRVAQLTQKTNQFNFTTKRYSESDISRFMQSSEYYVYFMSMKDRFGDNGTTGVMIIKEENKTWIIDTFLLSCRIIGRTLETVFLSHILNLAKRNNIYSIVGEYIPSTKNMLVQNIYRDHGFTKEEEKWILITNTTIKLPKWIKLITK